jgi:hypothetical protein
LLGLCYDWRQCCEDRWKRHLWLFCYRELQAGKISFNKLILLVFFRVHQISALAHRDLLRDDTTAKIGGYSYEGAHFIWWIDFR